MRDSSLYFVLVAVGAGILSNSFDIIIMVPEIVFNSWDILDFVQALYQEKEQLQLQLEDQLKQISALRNQLDEMRHRGDYSGGFLDDSQTSSLQRQVDNQREVTEEKDKEVRGQSWVKVKLLYF